MEKDKQHQPTLTLLKDGHIRPLAELIDEIIEHTFDYYSGKTTWVSDALQISRNTLYRKGLTGSKHKALGVARPRQRKQKTVTSD